MTGPFHAVYAIANPGGEGKTTSTLVFETIFELLGKPVALLDVDEGNGALCIAREEAQGLGWALGPSAAPKLHAMLQLTNVALDLGANLFASGAPVVRLFYSLDTLLRNGGHTTTAFVPFSTSKLGSPGSAQTVADELALRGLNVCFVRVNRDGSNTYEGQVKGHPITELGYLDTGYMALVHRLSKERSIASLIRDPEPDFELATSYIAEWVRQFAAQPEIIAAVGGDVGPILDSLNYQKPPKQGFVQLKEDHVRNDHLRGLIAETAKRTAV